MTNIPAYIDEAGDLGLLRDLTAERDAELGLMCALVFDPGSLADAVKEFTFGFEEFCAAVPPGSKLHITDAFAPGSEEWSSVARRVRSDFFAIIRRRRPMVIYAAYRLKNLRLWHEHTQGIVAQAKANRRSSVKIVGSNRPSDQRVEDSLMTSLALLLDGFAEITLQQVSEPKVDLFFDETDRALVDRYKEQIERTRNISNNSRIVKGFDPSTGERLEGRIDTRADGAGIRLDSKFIGEIQVLGKDNPLILAADMVANSLFGHLKRLPIDAPVNAPSSIVNWELQERVWGARENAIEDLLITPVGSSMG